MRTASIVICLIVIGSFVVFAVNQTKSASAAQQEELAGADAKPRTASTGTPTATGAPAPTPTTKAQTPTEHENGVHEALDEASNTLTSPFGGIVSSSDSEWATRGVRLVLALLVYGFGLGYLARALRVRV